MPAEAALKRSLEQNDPFNLLLHCPQKSDLDCVYEDTLCTEDSIWDVRAAHSCCYFSLSL